jgi:hypothetical protein
VLPFIGEWEYTTGMDDHVGIFRLVFRERGVSIDGRYMTVEQRHMRVDNLPGNSEELKYSTRIEKSPARWARVRKFVQTSMSPASFRWEADGYCWNVSVEGDRMSGVRNGGKCSDAGFGSAARLLAISAKKRPSSTSSHRVAR